MKVRLGGLFMFPTLAWIKGFAIRGRKIPHARRVTFQAARSPDKIGREGPAGRIS